jgi:CTP synthase
VVEFARNVAGLKEANSSEFNEFTPDAVIYLMLEWFDQRSGTVQRRDASSEKGATMRLGAYPCHLTENTLANRAYGVKKISERHRHRYEFNNDYKTLFVEKGMVVSGSSPAGDLVEIIEIEDHPWFLGCQFHPEFKSRPMDAHPLFRDFIKAALEYSNARQH